MTDMQLLSFLLLYFLAIGFGFFDGFHGSANIVATVIYSRAMRPGFILPLAALAEFVGPFLFGVAIAETIGEGLAAPAVFTIPITIAAITAAIIWKAITGWLGLPASSSHSLLGGLVGAVITTSGVGVLQSEGIGRVVIALAVSPVLGLLGGFAIMRGIVFLSRPASPRINVFFKRGQLLTAVLLALSHGTNNAQKTMGIISLGLVASGLRQEFAVPLWVIASSAASLALGTLFGGRRIIKTIGAKFYKVRPVHGFAAQLTAASIILAAAIFGGPVSTTQTVSSTIAGVGSAERLSKVRWRVFYDIGIAWLLTIPATMFIAALLAYSLLVIGNW